jgi:DNA-binding GntR family transcriptional regulator
MIRQGTLACGQRLDQRELAQQLNLTTAPLREALSSLESEGLVQRIPGVGIFCRAYTVDEIEELIEIRGMLEALAARRAATRLTPAMKNTLYELAQTLSNPEKYETKEQYVQIHVRFHILITEISDSEYLKNFLERNQLIEQVLSNISANMWPVEAHDHIALMDAIASGDEVCAEKAMRDHITPTYTERLQRLREEYQDQPIM